MRKIGQILQVAFTYVGTIVGAGFASGQEILQFFTRYGWMAVPAIGIAAFLFIWLGIKIMLLAHDADYRSHEDLNRMILGPKLGGIFSLFLLVVLLGTSAVMLAGAGSLFQEQLHFHYQVGLLLTLFIGFWVLQRGINGILAVNSIVVPCMMFFIGLIFIQTLPQPTLGNWLSITSDASPIRIAFSPILYTAFNLATAQAVLVPLGTAFRDRKVLVFGGVLGGLIIGTMLLVAHIALSAHMPGIHQFEIPMAQLMKGIAPFIQLMYTLVIFGEIFTTFVADIYGLSLQVGQRIISISKIRLTIGLLTACFLIAQLGFSSLLSFLYPLFGVVSICWLVVLIFRSRSQISGQSKR
ncbi:MAG: hypothetical protein K6T85_14145 [Gorillibacterium sp.]|nr:hypothetical protein [Gorillibacterium sp.]